MNSSFRRTLVACLLNDEFVAEFERLNGSNILRGEI